MTSALVVPMTLCVLLSVSTLDGHIWEAQLDASQVVPPNQSPGSAVILLDYSTEEWYDPHPCFYEITYRNLSSPTTGAHLRQGRSGANGPDLITLISEAFSTPAFGGVEIPWDILFDLESDSLYVVITTESYPDGEVRGEFMNITPPAVEESTWGMVRASYR